MTFLAAAAVAALASCSSRIPVPVENERPHVRLTGGAAAGQKVRYSTEFFWTGWDRDGIIDHYQYAIDIPPELFPSLDDAGPSDVAWTDTTAFRARFRFTTLEPDSVINPDGTMDFTGEFKSEHTFYVRSVDNEGLASAADYLTFTATNITPRTTITMPPNIDRVAYLRVGRQLNVAWEGIDPDSPDPLHLPRFYEWKLIPLPDNRAPIDLVLQYIIDVSPGPNFQWHRVGADTTSLRLALEVPKTYVFAVRAVDEAGAVESVFIPGRNAFALDCSDQYPGRPTLTVSERGAGTHTFPQDGEVWEIEVPAGACFRFDFTASAVDYGGEIQCFNWGIDVPDADDEGPNSGFHGCSLLPYTFEPICFPHEGIHTLTVKCRDTGGGVTTGTVLIHVIAFARDHEVLYVDDHRLPLSQGVTDALMDERALAMLAAAGYTDVAQIDTWGPNDSQAAPLQIRLSDLADYRLVVWSCFGPGFSGETALSRANVCPSGRVLQTFAGAGGAVWIYGQTIFGSFKPSGSFVCQPELNYDENHGLFFEENDFVCSFLGLCNADIRTVRTNSRKDGLLRGVPTRKALEELFPAVEVDSTVLRAAVGGIPFVDAMFQPTFASGLDTLYLAEAVTPESKFNRKPIAFRYADSDPVPKQGPLAVFGFPMHLLKQGSGPDRTGTGGLARALADWFRRQTDVQAPGN